MPARNNGKKKRVSLANLAAKAGVSVATVSLVLNRPATSRASAQTRSRVMAAVKELGYDTDALRTSARQRFAVLSGARILLFVNTGKGGRSFFEPAFTGFSEVAARYNIRLEIGSGPDDPHDEASIQRYIESADVGGYVLAGALPMTAERLLQKRLPVVVLGDFFTPSQACAQVRLNNFKGGYLAADALLNKGHTKIGFAGFPSAGEFHAQRMAGAFQRLYEAGLALDHSCNMCADAGSDETCAHYLDRVLKLSQPPTAFVAASFGMCRVLMGEFTRRGVKVPRDISIVSFDRVDSSPDLAAIVTTIEYDMEAMGRLTMNKMVKLLTGSPDETTVELTFPRLVERSSVRALKSRRRK